MAAPTEEERRLLREYRITTVPPRRASCSPATSNASSSTTTNLKDLQLDLSLAQISQPQSELQLTPQPQQQPKQTQPQILNNQSQPQPHHNYHQQQKQEPTHGHNGHHHNGHNHHHHHHNHNNIGNYKRHKTSTPNLELTTEELNRMLELVSELNYLKLIGPKNVNTPTATLTSIANKSSENGENQLDSNGKDRKTPYIFEKVDYINKISIRRKALRKKLRKGRNKSRIISPSISESPNNKL